MFVLTVLLGSSVGDERPPQSSSPSATPGSNGQRWVPPSSLKRATPKHDERTNSIFRKVRGILNKLTPEKFDKLGLELLNVGIDSQVILRGIILLIFEKALDEPKYSSLYAQLCQRLCEDTPNFEPSTSGAVTFKRLLLTKCQDEFENRTRATAAFEKDGALTEEEEEQYILAKHKMLGNIKFIGELGKLEMVQARILHQCIKQLLAKKKRDTIADVSEDLECLCQIMKTIGRQLDHDQARLWMDQYFKRMNSYRAYTELPSRIRFMLQDVTELRENNWVPRKSLRENGPKTIQQVHSEAARETGHFAAGQHHNSNVGMMGGLPPSLDLFGRPMNGMPPSSRPHVGSMSDMFGPVPTSPPTMGGIGTGPGVIPMDQPFSSGYQRGRGRGGYQQQFGRGGPGNKPYNRGGGSAGQSGAGGYQPRHQDDHRSRMHDDSSDEDERPGSGGSNGSSSEGGRGGHYHRGGSGQNYYNNRGGGRQMHHNNHYNNNDGYNRNPNYQSNFNPNYQPRERGDQGDDSGTNNRGFGSRGGRGSYYDNRGSRGGRGGHYDREQGYGKNSDNYGNYRNQHNNSDGGYSNNKGYTQGNRGYGNQGYNNDQQGGYNNQGYGGGSNNQGYDRNQQNFRSQQHNQQQAPKDLEKLPPRFRKQLAMQHHHQDGTELSSSPPAPSGGGTSGGRSSSPQHHNTAAVADTRVESNAMDRTQSNRRGDQDGGFLPFQSDPVVPSRGSPILERGGGSPGLGGSNTPPPTQLSHQGPPQSYTRSPSKMEEISLRPVRMPTAFRPNIPSMLPKSAQGNAPPPLRHQTPHFEAALLLQQQQQAGGGASKPNPMGPAATSLTIKTVPAGEKAKDKKKGMSQEELKAATDKMLKEFLEEGYNLETAVRATKDMKPPRRFIPELVTFLILRSLDQSDTDRENVGKLITALKDEDVLGSELFMEGYTSVLDQMKSLEADVPLVKSYVSKFAAYAVASEVMTLTELSEPLENGRHYPLFLLCLQQVHKLQGKEWLVKIFNESRLDLQKMLPECDQSKERMLEILEDRGLSFMFPLLHVQSDLWKQIQQNPNPNAIYKWIKENCSSSLFTDPKFISIVFTNVIKYIVTQTTLGPDVDTEVEADKALVKKEKELVAKLKGVLAAYIHDSIPLQLVAIYAVQVFCHSHNFPKGLLLRLFVYMYDMEIIDEEAFLKWKEDINDHYPGKGKALFQVNQWLLWLEQADSESSDED